MKRLNKGTSKLGAIVVAGAMFATTLGLGVASILKNDVKAATANTAETIGGVTVRNVEDVVTSKTIKDKNGVSFALFLKGGFDNLTSWNATAQGSSTVGAAQASVYDRLPQEGDWSNENIFNGNIALSAYRNTTATLQNATLSMRFNGSETEDMISFRTQYGAQEKVTLVMRNDGAQYYYATSSKQHKSGYFFLLNGINNSNISFGKYTSGNRDHTMLDSQGNEVNGAASISYTNAPAEGDELVITYGIYDTVMTVAETEKSVNAIYLRIKNETQNNIVFENTYFDDTPETTAYGTDTGKSSGTVVTGEENARGYFGVSIMPNTQEIDVYRYSAMTVGGVNRPIFTDGYHTEYDVGEYEVNSKLSSILATINENDSYGQFTVGINDMTILSGQNIYDVTYEVDYYGNKISYPTKLTVTGVSPQYMTTVDARYIYGNTLADIVLPSGYAFKAEDLTKALRVGTMSLVGTYNGTSAATITVNVSAPVAQEMENVIISDEFQTNESLSAGALKFKNGWDGAATTMRPSWNTSFATNSAGINRLSIYNRVAMEGDSNNVNDFDGNISLSAVSTNNAVSLFIGMPNGEGLISFRTKYDVTNAMHLGMGIDSTTAAGNTLWSNVHNLGAGGYVFALNQRGENIYTLAKANDGETAQRVLSFVEYNGEDVNTTDISNSTNAPQTGTNIIITYGTFDSMLEDGTLAKAVYICLYNEDTDSIFFEHTYYDVDYAKTLNADSADSFMINIQKDTNAEVVATTIGGINQPIFESVYETKAVSADEAIEDAKLSTVTLPEGYDWKDENATFTYGLNSYVATYTNTNYYGKTFSIDVNVSIEVKMASSSKVTFLAANGSIISEVNGKAGQTITFATATASVGKTFIGWKDANGKLYPAGYVFTAPQTAVEMTYTAVEIGFALEDGAAVRFVTANEDGKEYGGLRFTVKLDDLTYVTALKAAIVPYEADYYANGAFTATAMSLSYSLTEEHMYQTADGYNYYGFTLTDILYSNYNRAFAGMAFVNVTYEDGSTKNIFTAFNATDNVRSVQQAATNIYAKHLAAIGSEEKPLGLYGENALGILEGYINGVVDIVYDDGEFAVTTTEDGLGELEPTYSLVENGTTVEGDDVTIQVQIDVPETLYAEGDVPHIPVTVRVKVGTEYVVVRIKKPTIIEYKDGVATISFKLSALNV